MVFFLVLLSLFKNTKRAPNDSPPLSRKKGLIMKYYSFHYEKRDAVLKCCSCLKTAPQSWKHGFNGLMNTAGGGTKPPSPAYEKYEDIFERERKKMQGISKLKVFGESR